MAQNYYQKEIETMSTADMKKLQSEKLVKQVKHVYENVEYYRNLMDEKGVKPEDIRGIEDLHKLPFLSKADLRDAYPYCLPHLLEIVSVFSQHREQRAAVLLLSTHKMTLTFGKIAVHVQSLR